jgi:hypothetical protein
MGILLWVLGALALGSGITKLGARTRALLGTAPLTVIEIAAGACAAAGAGLGLARIRPLAWLTGAVVLVLVTASTVSHARRLARQAEERERSAERRFRRYLELPDRE